MVAETVSIQIKAQRICKHIEKHLKRTIFFLILQDVLSIPGIYFFFFFLSTSLSNNKIKRCKWKQVKMTNRIPLKWFLYSVEKKTVVKEEKAFS